MCKTRVALIQQGARRNYVYARQLAAAGLLHSLITDAAWVHGQPTIATRLASKLGHRFTGPVERRTIKGLPRDKVQSSLWPNLTRLLAASLHEERIYAAADEVLAWRFRWAVDDANVVLNYHGNGGSLLDWAKRRGARIVTDFVVTPKYLEIEQAERRRWPGWERQWTPERILAFYRRRMEWLVRVSDFYLCPSEAVARDLAGLPGFDPARVRLAPYGSSGVLLCQPRPVPGRVLFVGAAGLRKGLPYLAEAARILRRRQPGIVVAVAGHAPTLVRTRPETRDLTFLGVLDRTRMAQAYASADVFCLPSLAEGSATSVFEAMAHGLPIVTTRSSGSVVSDGVDGIIVPERDGVAIADAIEHIVMDRALRTRMSEGARATAARYSDAACGQHFIEIIRQVA